MRIPLNRIAIGLAILLVSTATSANTKHDAGTRTTLEELDGGVRRAGSGARTISKRLATGPIEDTIGNQEVEYQIYQGVMGRPGIDFPAFTGIPATGFNCRGTPGGYYADLETNCQVFHICDGGRKISFLCPNGTIFKQQDLICDWWFKVDCHSNHSPLPAYENSHSIPIISLPENQPLLVEEHESTDFKIEPKPIARNHQRQQAGRKSSTATPNRGKIHYQSENSRKFTNSRQYSSFEYSSEYENDDTSSESKKGTRHSTSVSLPHYTDSNNYRTSVTAQVHNERIKPAQKNNEEGYFEGNQRNFYHYYNADGSNSTSTLELINYKIETSTKAPAGRGSVKGAVAKKTQRKLQEDLSTPLTTTERLTTKVFEEASLKNDVRVNEHAISMIKTLQQLEADREGPEKFLGSSRAGLDIPPSASPQTIRTLAEYFATAPDNFITKAPFNTPTATQPPTTASQRYTTEIPTSSSVAQTTVREAETTRPTVVESAHLSKGTLDKYVELFAEKPRNYTYEAKNLDLAADAIKSNDGNNDLDVQQSSGPLNYATGSAQIRELAQVFTHALSAYLQDPETFRRVLAEIRPTEPPPLFSNEVVDQTTTTTTATYPPVGSSSLKPEEEILDFSDVTKSTTKKPAEEATTLIPYVNAEQNVVDPKSKTPGSNIIADVLEKSESLYYDRQDKKSEAEDVAPTLSTIIVSDSWLQENGTDDYFPENKTQSHDPAKPYGQGVRHQNSTPISIAYPTSLADVQAIPLHWGQDLATVKTPEDADLDLVIPAVDLIPPQDKNVLNILEPSGEFLPPEVEQTTHFSSRQGKSEKDEQLQRSQSQSFVPKGNAIDFEVKQKFNPGETTTQAASTTNEPTTTEGPVSTTATDRPVTAESLWTTSATVGELWRSTIFLDPLTINQELEEDKTVTPSPHTYLPRSTTSSSVTAPVTAQTTTPAAAPESTTHFGSRTSGFDRRTSKFPAVWDEAIHTTLEPRIEPIYDRRTSTTAQTPGSTPFELKTAESGTTRSPFTYVPTAETPTTSQGEATTQASQERSGKALASEAVMEKRAQEMFGKLNASSADTLMNVMKHADSDTTVRRLILLLVQTCDEDIDKTVEESRAALLDALISMPVEDTNLDAFKKSAKTFGAETLVPQESVGYRSRKGKALNFLTDANSVAAGGPKASTTTTAAPTTTATREPELTTVTTEEPPTTTEGAVVAHSVTTYRSKAHRKFIIHAIDGGSVHSGEGFEDDGKHNSSDSRAIELLRSLYSLAAKWG